MEDLFKNAFNVGDNTKFLVFIGDEEVKEISYIELGVFLVTNSRNIKNIKINLK